MAFLLLVDDDDGATTRYLTAVVANPTGDGKVPTLMWCNV